ncbi:clavata3/esr (cle)-related protein 12 [Quercus suber]|uniref:Clavata3/esr (Cle)-related protein 12 n=1 Tax=Quercus suber TaxID=58331 RepID=A0AAW0K181_QUESU
MVSTSLKGIMVHLHGIMSKNINTKQITTITYSTVLSNHPLITRKVLASRFDFTPFVKHHQQQQQQQQDHMKRSQNMHVKPDPDGSEIDPRYGVEKRRVPTVVIVNVKWCSEMVRDPVYINSEEAVLTNQRN